MAIVRTSICRGLAVLMALFLLAACSSSRAPSTAPLPEIITAPLAGENTEQPGGQPAPAQDVSIAPSEMVLYPKEVAAYEAYLDVIKGRPAMADSAVIEGTVVSIQPGEVCPYQEEPCPIEPYPDDWGTVRVDKIVEYATLGGPGSNPVEGQAGGAQPSEGQTSPGYTGAGAPPSIAKYNQLQPGQELTAHFLLTTRPARVRQLASGAFEGVGQVQPMESDAGQVVTHRADTGNTTLEPVPSEGGYFVFSTLAADAREPGELLLPGLTAGARFRARVLYDGTLYIQEYELIP